MPGRLRARWIALLQLIAGQRQAGGGASGLACRLLLEAAPQCSGKLSSWMPTFKEDQEDAVLAWWGGFLRGSLAPLLSSRPCRDLLNRWVLSLAESVFQAWLPLLRQALGAAPLAQRLHLFEVLEENATSSWRGQGLVTEEAARTLRLLWRPLTAP
jgi:hypothetical protein